MTCLKGIRSAGGDRGALNHLELALKHMVLKITSYVKALPQVSPCPFI